MTRQRYAIVMPSLMLAFICAAFAVGFLFPAIPATFFLAAALVAGVGIVVIDRALRKRVDEALTDERVQLLAERAALLSFRIGSICIMLIGFGLMYLLPPESELRLIGLGAILAIALLSALLGGVLFYLKRTR